MSAPLVADTGGVLRALGRPQWPRGLGGVRERPPRRFSCIFFPGAAPTRFSRAISDGRATRRGFSLGSHRHVPLMERDSFTDARDALKRSVEHRQMFERSRRHRSDRLRRRRMLARGAPLWRSEWWNRAPAARGAGRWSNRLSARLGSARRRLARQPSLDCPLLVRPVRLQVCVARGERE